MYEVKVISQFSSAHNLRGYKGKCEAMHGHNWKVEAVAISEKLNDIGMVIDFKDLKKSVNEIMDELDHKYINDMENFKEVNPTSENIAKYVFKLLSEKRKEIKIKEVTIWETETSSATYSE